MVSKFSSERRIWAQCISMSLDGDEISVGMDGLGRKECDDAGDRGMSSLELWAWIRLIVLHC